MLAQFQSLYPTGCLTSELVQVYNGKYIVRASVQIEAVTRATGMAMSESLEQAEDLARQRALMVLNLKPAANLSPGISEAIATPQQILPITPAAPQKPETPPTSTSTPAPVTSTVAKKNDYPNQDFGTTNNVEKYFDNPTDNITPITNTQSNAQYNTELNTDFDNSLFSLTNNNVTPFTPRNTPPLEEIATSTTKRKKKNEPMDLSTAMAEIDIEMTRLGWGKEQGREHLIKTYNKRARSLLTDEELFDFLKHLKSLPSPISPPDPLAGF